MCPWEHALPERNSAIMPDGPQAVAAKFGKVLAAWETLRSGKSFARLTLAQFRAVIQSASDVREEIKTLENQLLAAQDRRAAADREATRRALQVVNSVKGDPAEGEDGELYEAMGYVRKSARQSGLTRKKGATTGANKNAPLVHGGA